MSQTYSKEQAWELALLALCVWREARNQPFQGQVGVAWSVRNRVEHPRWWGTSVSAVVLHKYQYSSFNVGDPNASQWPNQTDQSWPTCLSIAEGVLNGSLADPTGGSTHYVRTDLNPKPGWVAEAAFKVQLGDHSFYVSN